MEKLNDLKFEIDDELTRDLPKCFCGAFPKEFLVKKKGPNRGRTFLSCKRRKCKYFKWTSVNPVQWFNYDDQFVGKKVEFSDEDNDF